MEFVLFAAAASLIAKTLLPQDEKPKPKSSKELEMARTVLAVASANPDITESDREKLKEAIDRLK